MKDFYLFAQRFLSRPSAVGSLIPSSERLALSIIQQPTPPQNGPTRYLEAGAGSGALTTRLVKKMGVGDTLDVVENDPQFCAILRRKFGSLPSVTIHELSILDFKQCGYDVLISSLPLNAFRADVVSQILQKYEELVKPGGSLAYFEYLGLEKIKRLLLCGKPARDFKETLLLKHQFADKYGKRTSRIWLNIPPARVIHCQM